jgi:hypothetical protein
MNWEITSEGGFLRFRDNQHIFYVPKADIKRISFIRSDTVKLETSSPSRDLYLKLSDFAPGAANNQTALAAWLIELIGQQQYSTGVQLEGISDILRDIQQLLTQSGDFEILRRLIHQLPYRIDDRDPNIIYKGYLQSPGQNEEASLWAISRTTKEVDGITRVEWVDGKYDFTNQWSARIFYDYS